MSDSSEEEVSGLVQALRVPPPDVPASFAHQLRSSSQLRSNEVAHLGSGHIQNHGPNGPAQSGSPLGGPGLDGLDQGGSFRARLRRELAAAANEIRGRQDLADLESQLADLNDTRDSAIPGVDAGERASADLIPFPAWRGARWFKTGAEMVAAAAIVMLFLGGAAVAAWDWFSADRVSGSMPTVGAAPEADGARQPIATTATRAGGTRTEDETQGSESHAIRQQPDVTATEPPTSSSETMGPRAAPSETTAKQLRRQRDNRTRTETSPSSRSERPSETRAPRSTDSAAQRQIQQRSADPNPDSSAKPRGRRDPARLNRVRPRRHPPPPGMRRHHPPARRGGPPRAHPAKPPRGELPKGASKQLKSAGSGLPSRAGRRPSPRTERASDRPSPNPRLRREAESPNRNRERARPPRPERRQAPPRQSPHQR